MSTNSAAGSTNNLLSKRKSRGDAHTKSKHQPVKNAETPIPPLKALMSLREWKERYSAGQAGMPREINSPFWRSIALNPYDLFTEQSLLAALKATMARLFSEKLRKSRICYLLNLRLLCQYRAEQAAQLLDTYVFADEQLTKIPDDCAIVVFTMSIMPYEEAVHALQLRTPFLPIGSMARYNAAYTENRVSTAMKHGKMASNPLLTRPSDINYKTYSDEELLESDLLNRFMKRGAYLYDELRTREPVTLAYLIAERKMKEMQLQEQEREKHRTKSKKKKKSRKSAKASASASATSSNAIVNDDDDDDEGISLSSEEEASGTESDDDDDAASELPFADDSDDDDDNSKVAHTPAASTQANPDDDDDDDDASSGSTDLSAHLSSDEDRVVAAAAPVSASNQMENEPAESSEISAVAQQSRARNWRYAAPNALPVIEPAKKKTFDDPSQPLKIDLKRADECEWMRLVVAKNAYRFLFDISCVVPNKAMLLEHARAISVNIEVGISTLPQAMKCDEEQTSMIFQTVNAARLKLAIAEAETSRQQLASAVAVAVTSTEMPVDTVQQQQAPSEEAIVEPRVSITSLLSPQFHDENDCDVLPIRDSEIDHPLNDYRRFVDASKLTLYEINCYASQRLAVLMLAYQAYFIESIEARRQPHIESLIRSQYPMHSGATYHLIHGFAGAKDRQLMHEGIGLAMLCFCAKHKPALAENLLLLEMCYLKHKQEMKAMEFDMGHNDDDGDENRNNEHEEGKNIQLQAAIEKHSQTIMNYIEACADVLSLENDPLVLEQQEVATYIEFFAILKDLINEWEEALAEIDANRQYEPATENGDE